MKKHIAMLTILTLVLSECSFVFGNLQGETLNILGQDSETLSLGVEDLALNGEKIEFSSVASDDKLKQNEQINGASSIKATIISPEEGKSEKNEHDGDILQSPSPEMQNIGKENSLKGQTSLPLENEGKNEDTMLLFPSPEMSKDRNKEIIKTEEGNPKLIISEVYFDGNDEWIELYNDGDEKFNGKVSLTNIKQKNGSRVNDVSIFPKGFLIIGNTLEKTITDIPENKLKNQSLSVKDKDEINITLQINNKIIDTFFVDSNEVKKLNDKKASFQKINTNGERIIEASTGSITFGMQEGYFGNPGKIERKDEPIPQNSPQEETLPELVITEASFDTNNSWIEITNMGEKDFSGPIILSGVQKNNRIIKKIVGIPAGKSLILSENEKFLNTGNLLYHTIEEKYFLNRNSGLQLTLTRNGKNLDQMQVHPEWTKFLKGKNVSFEKIALPTGRLTTRTSLDRRKNIKGEYVANPGVYYTEAENVKDISQPKEQPEPEATTLSGFGIELPLNCGDFTDRYRLEIQEIFWGNKEYKPFIELKWTDTPTTISALRLSGTVLKNEIFIEKNEDNEKLWELNTTFLISHDDSRYDEGIDTLTHPDFSLENRTGYIILEGLYGQDRQVLDIVILTGGNEGMSKYFGGEKAECIPLFTHEQKFSPGFDKKFLDFFEINSEPKIKYIQVGGGGGFYSCPTKEDLCPSPQTKKNKEKTMSETEVKLINDWISQYKVKIEHIEYDPPGVDKDNESITMILTSGDSLDLSLLTLDVNGVKKKINGILQHGISQTFVGNFGFPNSSKTKDSISVALSYGDTILDRYYYYFSSSDKKTKEQEKEIQNGVKVFSVLDGDTFRYRDENGKLQSVRLLGVDAPESNTARYRTTECYGKEAKTFLTEKIKGKVVQLQFDNGEIKSDRYGRILAYVYVNDTLINEEMITAGYAKEYTYKTEYGKQKTFKEAEEYAKMNKRGMRNPIFCPHTLEKDEEQRLNQENLIIKISHIDYDPPGTDKDNETITLSIFERENIRKAIDFTNQFGLFIFEKTGSGNEIAFDEIDNMTGKFKDLSFLGKVPFSSPVVLKGDFGLPNTKSTCIGLVQKEHIFDIACYDIEKKEQKEKDIKEAITKIDIGTALDIHIISILPNPIGKDTGKEKISLLLQNQNPDFSPLNLSDGFYLLINGKTKKKLSGILENNKAITLEGNFNFPNSASCISIGKENTIFDTFCYGNPKEGSLFTKNNEILAGLGDEELTIIKGAKIIKQGNKNCIKYKNQIFNCRNLPNIRSQKEKERQLKAQAYKASLEGLEELLKSEYRAWYQQTQINDYFSLIGTMKKDLNKNIFSTSVRNHSYSRKDFSKVFEKKSDNNPINVVKDYLFGFIDPEFLETYHQKKEKWITQLPEKW